MLEILISELILLETDFIKNGIFNQCFSDFFSQFSYFIHIYVFQHYTLVSMVFLLFTIILLFRPAALK